MEGCFFARNKSHRIKAISPQWLLHSHTQANRRSSIRRGILYKQKFRAVKLKSPMAGDQTGADQRDFCPIGIFTSYSSI